MLIKPQKKQNNKQKISRDISEHPFGNKNIDPLPKTTSRTSRIWWRPFLVANTIINTQFSTQFNSFPRFPTSNAKRSYLSSTNKKINKLNKMLIELINL